MTIDQKLAALAAIRAYQDTIRGCLNCNTSPAMVQHTTKRLKNLDGAYDAINAIETVSTIVRREG